VASCYRLGIFAFAIVASGVVLPPGDFCFAIVAFRRPIAATIIAAFIILCILVLPQQAGRHPGEAETAA
jgi:hypothetical protein